MPVSICALSLHTEHRHRAEDAGTDPVPVPYRFIDQWEPHMHEHRTQCSSKFVVGVQVSHVKNLEIYKAMVC